MKAPDKIYVREYPQGLNQMWSSVKATETSAIAQYEYIRKDALIEWAKEHYTGMDITKRDMWDGGYNCAMKQLIDKLNSM